MRLKRYVNIILVIGISIVLLIIWVNGLNWVYAKILAGISNIFLSGSSSIGLEKQSGKVYFIVNTLIEGRKGSFPQEATLIILPFIMMLTWQILLFVNISWRKAMRSTAENLGAFILVQVIYLFILTGYYKSDADKFFFHLLVDSFYIIGLFLIVKDAIRFRLIGVPGKGEKEA
jgi:hypothetical protein